MKNRIGRMWYAAAAGMLLLLLIWSRRQAESAPAFAENMLLGAANGCSVYAGTLITGEITSYSREMLLEGPLLCVGNQTPLPQDTPVQQARNVRKLIGLYVPAAQNVSLSEETIYALCALCDENPLLHTWIVSGMRSPDEQSALQHAAFERYRSMYDVEEALRMAQIEAPTGGKSEHQLATVFDVQFQGALEWAYADPLERSEDGRWLMENAWRFGFIRRYAPDKVHITGVSSEALHFRYVGKTHAAIMQVMNWCLEEYLEALHAYGGLTLGTESGTSYVLCTKMTPQGVAFPCPAGYLSQVSADNLGYAVCALTSDQSSVLDR